MSTIAPDIIESLTGKHIARYKKLIDSGRRYVRTKECEAYLKIWQSVADKDYDWDKLTTIERMEVQDAFYDEM